MKRIIKIEAKLTGEKKKKRVAAYARVSTSAERLKHSLSAQISYYSALIQKNPGWEFVRVYADDGISGTGTAKRTEFQQMINDCTDGKIDLILTKSVSRFARNTVDSLTAVRELRSIGVEIFFEKENIWTLDSKGELLITIMSSLAQEESRSISENVTWGHRKRFSDGKVMIPLTEKQSTAVQAFIPTGSNAGAAADGTVQRSGTQITQNTEKLCTAVITSMYQKM